MKLKDNIYEVTNWLIQDSFQVKKEYDMADKFPIATYTIRFQIGSIKAINKCEVILRWLVSQYNKMASEIRKKRYE